MQGTEKEGFIRQKALEHLSDAVEKIYWSLHAIGKLRRYRACAEKMYNYRRLYNGRETSSGMSGPWIYRQETSTCGACTG